MIKTFPCSHNLVPRNEYTDSCCLTKQVLKCVLYCLMTISEHRLGTTGILYRTIPATETTTAMNMQLNCTHVYTEIESEPIGGFFPSMESIGVCGSGIYILSIIAGGHQGGKLRACPEQLERATGVYIVPNYTQQLTASFLAMIVAQQRMDYRIGWIEWLWLSIYHGPPEEDSFVFTVYLFRKTDGQF